MRKEQAKRDKLGVQALLDGLRDGLHELQHI